LASNVKKCNSLIGLTCTNSITGTSNLLVVNNANYISVLHLMKTFYQFIPLGHIYKEVAIFPLVA